MIIADNKLVGKKQLKANLISIYNIQLGKLFLSM